MGEFAKGYGMYNGLPAHAEITSEIHYLISPNILQLVHFYISYSMAKIELV